jgi:hypothetical protein
MNSVDISKLVSMETYAKESAPYSNLLTSAEASMLLKEKSLNYNPLTKEQALTDVDLLLRALRSTYAAYAYFGEENLKYGINWGYYSRKDI